MERFHPRPTCIAGVQYPRLAAKVLWKTPRAVISVITVRSAIMHMVSAAEPGRPLAPAGSKPMSHAFLTVVARCV
jgi:hypothetical protein